MRCIGKKLWTVLNHDMMQLRQQTRCKPNVTATLFVIERRFRNRFDSTTLYSFWLRIRIDIRLAIYRKLLYYTLLGRNNEMGRSDTVLPE